MHRDAEYDITVLARLLSYALPFIAKHKDSWLAEILVRECCIPMCIKSVDEETNERIAGLSGVSGLRDLEGKLFIFDADGKHGIWMKDMLIPIDILWIDKNLKVIHIVENASPDSYPHTVFSPPLDARFVLEMNAFFVSSLKIKVGDTLTLPPSLIPEDIKRNLQ